MDFSLESVRLFLLDMDGTFYLDDILLPGALDFLALCRKRGVAFSFLTNNSSRSKADYLGKLKRLGVPGITEREVFTSGDATLLYLAAHPVGRELLLIGTPSLEQQFLSAGYCIDSAKPSAVVLGFDTTLTYQKLIALCNAVRAGIPYIATHPDRNCPVAGGYIPDIGATIAYVEAATGRRPDVVIGKPNPWIVQAAAQQFGCRLEEVCMVGDRLYTDIAVGASGCKTVLVLCGESRLEDLPSATHQPDLVCQHLAQLCNIWQKKE